MRSLPLRKRMDTDYVKIHNEAVTDFKASLVKNLEDPTFKWDQLIHLFLIEDSPLQEIFCTETVQRADVCRATQALYQSIEHLKEIEEDGGIHEEVFQSEEEHNTVDLDGDW